METATISTLNLPFFEAKPLSREPYNPYLKDTQFKEIAPHPLWGNRYNGRSLGTGRRNDQPSSRQGLAEGQHSSGFLLLMIEILRDLTRTDRIMVAIIVHSTYWVMQDFYHQQMMVKILQHPRGTILPDL